tara:strand:+ start:3848 stop:4066 length:219 start_codon:yes stop_codon:yes gene_type:complete
LGLLAGLAAIFVLDHLLSAFGVVIPEVMIYAIFITLGLVGCYLRFRIFYGQPETLAEKQGKVRREIQRHLDD